MSPQDDNRDRIAKRRIRQVFEYLKALHEHRNPAIRQVSEQRWSMWLDDLPRHPAIERPARMVAGETSETESTDSETYFVLRVRRPRLTPAPPPPDTLRDWIQPGWDDIRQPAVHVESINVRSPEGPTVTVRFDDDPERSALLDEWQRRRAEWQTAELPAKAAMSVFDRLYELHGRLTRDAEKFELVVGDGILSWSQPDGSLYHPVVLQKVQLTFDPVIPEFRIVDADADSELYTAILQSIPNVDPRALRTSREELESGGYHPLDLETSGLLAGLVNRLSAQGRILDDGRPPPGSNDPLIGRAPVIVLRDRTKGFGTAIERLLETLADRDRFCDALCHIVGCDGESEGDESSADSAASGGFQECDVLFGKHANREQARIATALDRHGSVLVQGPPGTGKSHTIANLIGHMLAQGRSVLVTSHSTKALRVLRGHLVPELRPLCVTVLESDLESRHQLEESVYAISRRLSESDADTLEREAKWLNEQRQRLLSQIDDLKADLRNVLSDEYRDIVLAGESFSPSDAARRVAQGRGLHDWIPGPVASGEPCRASAH